MQNTRRGLAFVYLIIIAGCGGGDRPPEAREVERADTAPAVCTDAGLSGDRCSGPWLYQKYPVCYNYAASWNCPGSYHKNCTAYTTCRNPAFGIQDYIDVDGSVTVHGDVDVQCSQPSPGHPPHCTRVCDYSTIDPASAAVQQYGGTSASVWSCTPTPGSSTCADVCQVTVHGVPRYNERAAYPCPTYTYECGQELSCRISDNGLDPNPRACDPDLTVRTSDPNLTLADLTAAVVQPLYGTPSCTTCETTSDPVQKYGCLTASLAANPAQRARIVRNLKQLLELHADALAADQRATIIDLYRTDPAAEETACGPDWVPPSTGGSCGDVSALNGTLAMCNRLLLPHAGQGAIVALLPTCVGTSAAINGLADGPTCKDAYLAAYRATTIALAKKVVSGPSTPGSGLPTEAQLQQRLYALGVWYDATVAQNYPAGSDRTQLYQDTSELVGAFWEDLRKISLARIETADNPDAAPVSPSDLDDARARSLEADRQVLLAALTPMSSTSKPPLGNGALLFVLSDALEAIGERARDLSVFHDAACQFRGTPCNAQPSKLSSLYSVLGAIDDAQALEAALTAAQPLASDPWAAVFTDLQAQHATVEHAVLDVTGASTYTPALLSAPPVPAAPPLAALAQLVGDARTATQSFKARGLFDPSRGQELISGIAKTTIDLERGDFTTKSGNLDTALTRYTDQLSTLVQQLVAQIHAAGDQQTITDRANEQQQKLANLTSQEVGLRNAAGHDSARFGALDAAFQAILQAPDLDPDLQVDRHSQSFDVSPADARFIAGTNRSQATLSSVAAFAGGTQPWTLHVEPGDQVHITITDNWNPTCAMQDFQRQWPNVVIHGSDSSTYNLNHINYDNIYTGPEGWTLTIASGTINATDNSNGWSITDSTTDSNSFNYCNAINITENLNVLGASQVANWCWSTTNGETDSDSYGTTNHNGAEVRATETLASGLHLANTPFPRLPAGSLVLVEMNAGHDSFLEMNAVHVLQRQSAIVASKSADLYLVVNDLEDASYCHTVPDPMRPGLHVELAKTTPLGAKIQKVQQGMAEALDTLRSSTQQYVDQGELLPHDAQHLTDVATQILRNHCGCSVSELPAALGDLWNAFVNQEIVNIERQARIASVQADERVATLELQAMNDDLTRAQGESRLVRLLPEWTLRNLDGEGLRFDAHALAQVMSDEIYPIAHLRYPAALTQIASDASSTIESLRSADWSTPLSTVATAAKSLADRVSSDLSTTISNTTPLHTTLVALRFPKPGTTPIASPIKIADDSRNTAVWSALAAGNPLSFTVRPEDLYDLNGRSLTLGCTEAVPIVQWMGVYVVLAGAPVGTDATLNAWHYKPKLTIDEPLVFATATQPEQYGVAPAWRRGNVHLTFGAITGVGTLTSYTDAQNELDGNGMSPFGTFNVTVSDLLPPVNPAGSPFTYASELVVVFQVETNNVGTNLTWTGTCGSGPTSSPPPPPGNQ